MSILCKLGFHEYRVHSFNSFEPNYILCFLKCARCDKKLTEIAIGDKRHPTKEVSLASQNWELRGELPK